MLGFGLRSGHTEVSRSNQANHLVDLAHVDALQGQGVSPLIRNTVAVRTGVNDSELLRLGPVHKLFLLVPLSIFKELLPRQFPKMFVNRYDVALCCKHVSGSRFVYWILFVK